MARVGATSATGRERIDAASTRGTNAERVGRDLRRFSVGLCGQESVDLTGHELQLTAAFDLQDDLSVRFRVVHQDAQAVDALTTKPLTA